MTHALTKYREAAGLTLEAFGHQIGANKGMVSKWENGSIPRPEYMRKIINATGNAVSPNDWYAQVAE